MQVIYSDNQNSKIENSIVTIGVFDGVHLAHKLILENLVKDAKRLNLKSVVVTFNPHPKHIVNTEYDLELLTSLNEKISKIENTGVDYLFVINFTKEFSTLSFKDYFKKYIIDNFKPKEIIVGYNHVFGKNREAGLVELENLSKEYNFKINIVNQILQNDFKISSTEIRNKLNSGNIESANDLLGYEYNISGLVIKGDGRGRKLGFPTANLKIDEPLKLLPKNGIYIVTVNLKNEIFFGLMNIGVVPTFHEKLNRRAEVYILDFSRDIYDEILKVNLLFRLRDELKFNSSEELIIAMKQDEINGRNWLNLYQERNKNVNKGTKTRIS